MMTRTERAYFDWGTEPRDRLYFGLERGLDLVFGLLYTALGIRALLDFFQARTGTGFYELIRSITQPFYRPFEGLFGSTLVDGHPVVWSLLVAIVAYMVLHGIVRSVLRWALV